MGSRLKFFGNSTDVVTSPVLAGRRPMPNSVERYVSQVQSGTIEAS